jgi:hypothetical protein
MITYLICIVGILICPWLNDRALIGMMEEEAQYEEEHKEELYGTDVMHVDSKGNVDLKDWK